MMRGCCAVTTMKIIQAIKKRIAEEERKGNKKSAEMLTEVLILIKGTVFKHDDV